MPNDTYRSLLQSLRLKRLQRGAEYALLVAMDFFFLLSFRQYYEWWMALLLAAITFGMNFQLTQLRERRRTGGVHSRQRLKADAFEAILFLLFVVSLTLGGVLRNYLAVGDQEYLAYVASLLIGLYMAGLAGELYWQAKHFSGLDQEERENYITNLKRTIILPYIPSRRR